MASNRCKGTFFFWRQCAFSGFHVLSTPLVWHPVTGSLNSLTMERKEINFTKKDCYYLWTTTRCLNPSLAKELYPLHASVWISIPGQHQYFIKGIMVGPARSGIRVATNTFCCGSQSPNTSKYNIVNWWDAKVSLKWISDQFPICPCYAFSVNEQMFHLFVPSPSIDKSITCANPQQPPGQSMQQCKWRSSVLLSGIRVVLVNPRPKADIYGTWRTRWCNTIQSRL